MRQRLLGGTISAVVAASVGIAAFIALPAGCGSSLADGWAARSSADDRGVITLAIAYGILSVVAVAGTVWLTGSSGGARAPLQGLRASAVTATFCGVLLGFGLYLVMALAGGWRDGSCSGDGSWFAGIVVLAAPVSWVAAAGLWTAFIIGRK
jgi:hypothetical protein